MLDYWFLFPLGLLVAAIAMSSAVAGSNFWIPVYLLGLGLEPRLAFWVSLLTMLFGFGSGVVRNVTAGTVSWFLVRRYLAVALPATALGALASTHAPVKYLLFAFAAFALVYGVSLVAGALRSGESAGGEVRHARILWPIGALAGFVHGIIATGAGVLLMPALLHHERARHHSDAVGSTVVLIFACSLTAVAFRIDGALFQTLLDNLDTVAAILLFVAPGVVLGGQLGPRIARRLPRRYLRPYVGAVLVAVGLLVGFRAVT